MHRIHLSWAALLLLAAGCAKPFRFEGRESRLSLPMGPGTLSAYAVTPDGGRAATAMSEKEDIRLEMWDLEVGRRLWMRRLKGLRILDLEFSGSGERLAYSVLGGRLEVVEASEGRMLLSREVGVHVWAQVALDEPGRSVVAAFIRPQGPFDLTNGHEGEAGAWNVETGERVLRRTLKVYKGQVAIHPWAASLAWIEGGSGVPQWLDVSTATPRTFPDLKSYRGHGIGFDLSGRYLMSINPAAFLSLGPSEVWVMDLETNIVVYRGDPWDAPAEVRLGPRWKPEGVGIWIPSRNGRTVVSIDEQHLLKVWR